MTGRFVLATMVVFGWFLLGTSLDAQLRRGAVRVGSLAMLTPAIPPAPPIAGRNDATPGPVENSLTNADVVKMARAGLSDVVITGVIAQASSARFDTGPDALIALKAARISDEVIGAMVRRGGSRPATETPGVAPAAAVSRALSLGITEAGIFLQQGATLQLLEPTGFTQGKTGGVFTSALTYGIKKAKWKAVVNRPRAAIRVAANSATFYFAFEKLGGGLSYTGGGFASGLNGASSPNEFVLARMTPKDNGRELVLGEFGMWGASSGTRSQDTVEMRIERLEPGLYRVTTGPLEPGREYCFFHSTGAQTPGVGTASAGTLFDFGVDAH